MLLSKIKIKSHIICFEKTDIPNNFQFVYRYLTIKNSFGIFQFKTIKFKIYFIAHDLVYYSNQERINTFFIRIYSRDRLCLVDFEVSVASAWVYSVREVNNSGRQNVQVAWTEIDNLFYLQYVYLKTSQISIARALSSLSTFCKRDWNLLVGGTLRQLFFSRHRFQFTQAIDAFKLIKIAIFR